MFSHLEGCEKALASKLKTIFLIQNGNPETVSPVHTSKKLDKQEIIKEAQNIWGKGKYKNIRIFSMDAVQYSSDDLQFVKNGQKLFISKGEDYDSCGNFGEYQRVKKLGQGGFGEVSLVKNRVTNQYAATKVMKASRLSSSSDIDMIFREAENLKTLNHPHIVKILNCYVLSDMNMVILMEYLQGGALKNYLKKKQRFSEIQAKKYLKQIVSAICYCHRQGIIHKDLKLENILMKDENTVKVADFGISGVAYKFNSEFHWGTARYMSPEILSKKQKINSTAVDVWACGIMLFYMVYGSYPFDGSSCNFIRYSILYDELQFPKKIQISQYCKELIGMMLEKDPQKRIEMINIAEHPWMKLKQNFMIANDCPQKVEAEPVKKQKVKRVVSNVNKKFTKSIVIPKRLLKEKHELQEELESYKMNRNMGKTEGKNFFKLRQKQPARKKSIQIGCSTVVAPVNHLTLSGGDSLQLRRKRDLFASWK